MTLWQLIEILSLGEILWKLDPEFFFIHRVCLHLLRIIRLVLAIKFSLISVIGWTTERILGRVWWGMGTAKITNWSHFLFASIAILETFQSTKFCYPRAFFRCSGWDLALTVLSKWFRWQLYFAPDASVTWQRAVYTVCSTWTNSF